MNSCSHCRNDNVTWSGFRCSLPVCGPGVILLGGAALPKCECVCRRRGGGVWANHGPAQCIRAAFSAPACRLSGSVLVVSGAASVMHIPQQRGACWVVSGGGVGF